MSAKRQLRGLEKVCRLYGRMQCGDVLMVWDYANEVAVPSAEMPVGSKRWCNSEHQRLKELRATMP